MGHTAVSTFIPTLMDITQSTIDNESNNQSSMIDSTTRPCVELFSRDQARHPSQATNISEKEVQAISDDSTRTPTPPTPRPHNTNDPSVGVEYNRAPTPPTPRPISVNTTAFPTSGVRCTPSPPMLCQQCLDPLHYASTSSAANNRVLPTPTLYTLVSGAAVATPASYLPAASPSSLADPTLESDLSDPGDANYVRKSLHSSEGFFFFLIQACLHVLFIYISLF